MQHVEVEHRYAAPPEVVWRVYTHHAGWQEWAGFPVSRLEREGAPDPNGVGAVRGFGAGRTLLVYEEVMAFEPPKRMVYRVLRGPVPIRDHQGEVLFEAEADGGTRIVWRCRFEPRGRVLGPLLRRLFERTFRRALEGLERHPELRAAAHD